MVFFIVNLSAEDKLIFNAFWWELNQSRKEAEEYRIFFERVWFALVVEKILPQRKKKGKKRKKADA